MPLDGLLQLLLLDADVALCHGGGRVLQELLDKGNIVPAVLINLRGVEFAKAVRADAVIAKVVTDELQVLLHGTFRQGEDNAFRWNPVVEAVAADELIQRQGNGECSRLFRFLLHDGKTVTLSVFYDVSKAQMDDVRDTQTKIRFEDQGGSDTFIRSASGKALLRCLDDGLILLFGERNGLDVRGNFLLCFGFKSELTTLEKRTFGGRFGKALILLDFTVRIPPLLRKNSPCTAFSAHTWGVAFSYRFHPASTISSRQSIQAIWTHFVALTEFPQQGQTYLRLLDVLGGTGVPVLLCAPVPATATP